MPALRFGFFPRPAFRGLFIGAPEFHLPEHTLALHFFLQRAQRLIDIIVADHYLYDDRLLKFVVGIKVRGLYHSPFTMERPERAGIATIGAIRQALTLPPRRAY